MPNEDTVSQKQVRVQTSQIMQTAVEDVSILHLNVILFVQQCCWESILVVPWISLYGICCLFLGAGGIACVLLVHQQVALGTMRKAIEVEDYFLKTASTAVISELPGPNHVP